MQSTKIGSVLNLEWRPGGKTSELPITAFDKDRLEEDALNRILPMVSDGIRHGEFITVLDHCENNASKTFFGAWSYKPVPRESQVDLPFGISLKVEDDGSSGGISSGLAQCFSDEDGYVDEKGQAAADAIESFLLAMACNGVDLSQAEIVSALETAVDSIGQNMD